MVVKANKLERRDLIRTDVDEYAGKILATLRPKALKG
jgi:hypothetical protein